MSKLLLVVCIVTSLAALGHTLWLRSTLERRLEQAVRQTVQHEVEQALAEREMQFVRALSPRLEAIYEDFDFKMPAQAPTTVEDLLDPMLRLVERVAGAS